jgi:transcriptional regulator with XRE-family HTH domain
MTFWKRFYNLCTEKNMKPNPVAKEIGISSGIITKWKNGDLPSTKYLIMLSEYFDCSTDYLLCKTDIKKEQTANEQPVSDDMKELIEIYQGLSPEHQNALLVLADQLGKGQSSEQS